MNKVFTIFTALLLALNVVAQAPQKMSYQAVIRDANNKLVISHVIGMRVSILQGSTTGSEVFMEIYNPNPQTNANGLLTMEIGNGIPLKGTFSGINWANGPYYLKTETDPTGGTNFTITGISQILSVPYVLHSKTAESVYSVGSFTHYIGESYGGGIIFHVYKDTGGVEHGLIVTLTDQSTDWDWSNVDSTLIGAAAQSTWDGLSNSNAIVGQSGHIGSAASLCLNSNTGGQNDWYLPSIDELNLLYNNRFIVNKRLAATTGAIKIGVNIYWSSTEYDAIYAWGFNFGSGYIYHDWNPNKDNLHYVRAVRAF